MVEKITLDNGVRILSEKISSVRTVSVGIWVKTGSRYEKRARNGISHFIEHMLFKGTVNRTAGELAVEMDMIGGQVNAFTTKDMTCFYVRTLDTCLLKALELLCDMFFNSRFDQSDVDMERSVIMEEIDMYEDSPEDLAVESLLSGCLSSSPLGFPVLGTKKSVSSICSADMRSYMQENYTADSIVVAMSGSFEQKCVTYLKRVFSKVHAGSSKSIKPTEIKEVFKSKRKRIEQSHICLGFPSISYRSEDLYALQMLNNIVGGGMSSRLFQNIREKRGLCYSVYSFNVAHEDTGIFAIYTACSDATAEEALRLICGLLRDFTDKGATDEEIERCRRQLETSLLMGLESTGARMNFIARNELLYDRIMPYEEILKNYDAVTPEDIRRVAGDIIAFDRYSLSLVGKNPDIGRMKTMVEQTSN